MIDVEPESFFALPVRHELGFRESVHNVPFRSFQVQALAMKPIA